MTVTSINKRMLEQSAATNTAGTAIKSSEDAAAEFTSALQQATSSLFGGANNASARTPGAVDALAGHFDQRADQAAAQPKAAPTTERTEKVRTAKQDAKAEKVAERAERKANRDDQTADRVQARDNTKAQTAEDTSADTPEDDGQNVVVQADDADQQVTVADQQPIQPEIVAALVEAPVQPVQQQVQAAQETVTVETKAATETVAAPVVKQVAEQQAKAEEAPVAAAQADDAGTDAQTTVLTADTAQTQDVATAAKNTAKNKGGDAAAQVQADDLAERLNDTGAQLKVQVEVAGPAKTAAATTTVDEAVTTQTAATATTSVLPTENAAQGQTSDQDADLSAAQQPGGAPVAQPQQQNAAAQVKPFDAILAAQAEAANGPDNAAPQAPTTQPIAGIGGVSGTAAAQKAQAPQAAQAPRQPQMPQAHEVIDQIKVQIASQSKDGTDTIKVQLKPTELGSIEIKLDVAKDGTVTTVVTADNKDTLDLLKKDQSSLQKALTDAGLKSDLGSMTFNLREGNQQQANQQQNFGSNTGRRRARLEAAAAADAASAKAAAAAQARWGMGRSGVDIQV